MKDDTARVLIFCNPPFAQLEKFREACITALRMLNIQYSGRVGLAFLVPIGGRLSAGAQKTLALWQDIFPHVYFKPQEFPVCFLVRHDWFSCADS